MDWLLLGGSLAAVAAVVGIVHAMRLDIHTIADADEARELAEAMVAGFVARDAVVDPDGRGAVVAGEDATLVLLKPMGAHHAARRLRVPVDVAQAGETGLRIASGESAFGALTIAFPEPAARDNWRQRLAGSIAR